MARHSAKPTHLRLVHSVKQEPSRALLDPANREIVLQLGHDLAAILIKIAVIQDGDSDTELNGGEAEDAGIREMIPAEVSGIHED